jgi:integration host factor subunit beta
MTKAELVEEVARAAELNKRDAEVIVETVFDSIISTLHRGEKVELRGFGSFRTRERGPRRGRNPKTGQPVDVPAKRVPYFKPGKELKEYFTDEPEAAQPDHSPEPDHSHEQPVEAAAPAVEAPAGAEEAASATPEATGSSSTDGFGGHGQ